MNEADENDAVLVERCLRGDRSAFEALLDRYQKPVFNAVYRILQSREDARDVTQTVFVKVYQNLAAFDRRFRFFSWVYRSAVNESLNFLRQRKRFSELPDRVPDRGLPADESVYAGELGRHVRQSLMQLKPKQRAIIVLRHLSGCSYRDLSQIFGIPEKTVKSRLFDARRMLRSILLKENVTDL